MRMYASLIEQYNFSDRCEKVGSFTVLDPKFQLRIYYLCPYVCIYVYTLHIRSNLTAAIHSSQLHSTSSSSSSPYE